MVCATVDSFGGCGRPYHACPMLVTSFLFLAVYIRIVTLSSRTERRERLLLLPLLLFCTSFFYHLTHSNTARRVDMFTCAAVGAVVTSMSVHRYTTTHDLMSLLPILCGSECVLLGWYGCEGRPISAPRHVCMHIVGAISLYLALQSDGL